MINVVIPSYNPGNYIFDCLNSLNRQTLNFDNFHVNIVFNATSEYIISEVNDFLLNVNFNYTVFTLNEAGVSFARNFILDRIFAGYICFIDDDDIISDNYLEELFLISSPRMIGISNFFDFHNDISNVCKGYLTLNNDFKGWVCLSNRRFFSNVCGKIIPREIIGNHRFNVNHKIGEDSLFIFEISKNIESIVFSINSIYYRRIRVNSASRVKKKKVEYINEAFLITLAYSKIFISSPFSYSFSLYFSRILAVYKKLFINLK